MRPLDSLTLERVAGLICDIDGPYEKTGNQIERFLLRVRWPGDSQYDGSPRLPWLNDILAAHADDGAAVDRLLCRICDPLEFATGINGAEPVAEELNRILAPERLSVSYVGGRPVLGSIDRENHRASYGPPHDLHTRIRRLAGENEAVAILLARADEAVASQDHGAFSLAIIGIGSFVEGLLYTVITDRDSEVCARGVPKSDGRRISAEKAGLAVLLDYTHRKGWIQTDAKDFMDKVRDYRNFVHPRYQIQYRLNPDLDTVRLCWAPVHALINDLEASLLPGRSPTS